MEPRNKLLITVSHPAEERSGSRYITMRAHSLTLRPDGELLVTSEAGERAFGEGAWCSFEVHRVPPFTGGADA